LGTLLRKAASWLEISIVQLAKGYGILALIAILILMIITVADVSLRFFLNKPITASVEITEGLMVLAAVTGFAWCALRGGHISVNILVSRFSKRGQSITEIINSLVVIFLCAIIASQNYREAVYLIHSDVRSLVTEMPFYPFYLIIALSFSILLMVMVINLIRSIIGVIKR
jgi:TRAP-type C4-dicarboxylate transport system permease small subunit